jgi:ferric-dicitrate binding protein FerR (iron transport regulator)
MSDEFNYIERIAGLIIKYHRGEISESEYSELVKWRDQSEGNRKLFDKLFDPGYVRDEIKGFPDIQALKKEGWEKVLNTIEEEDASIYPIAPKRIIHRTRYFIAASVAGLLVAGIWLYTKSRPATKPDLSVPALASNFKNDVAPGGNKAVLTLSDGSHVVLDSAEKGTIANQGVAHVVKLGDGQLAYKSGGTEEAASLAYNTLTTPAAGEFQVTLPDGSKVWLNNASSLRYPVAFTGKTREVELKGEAYFEIAPNAHQPFKVKVGETLVDVLGTSFNISAYADENNIKTTLLSGSVRVSDADVRTVLKPGEQAQVNEAGKMKVLKDVDVDGVVAWKNGWFHFEHADLRTVMRMLARWYDVDVVYEGQISDREFGGDIERKLNLSQVLEILQKNQVRFEIDGKKITVRP